MATQHDKYLRHLAFHLAGDLPEDIADAREVLRVMNEIVDKFYERPPPDLHLVRDDEEAALPH